MKGIPAMSAMRMQHYATFLQAFDYEIIYRNTQLHGNADAMSRLPVTTKTDYTMEEAYVIQLNLIEQLPVTSKELGDATGRDDTVKMLIQALKNGRTVEAKFRFGIEQHEFALQGNCLMRGIRVYIPKQLRTKILEELHCTHFGITRI